MILIHLLARQLSPEQRARVKDWIPPAVMRRLRTIPVEQGTPPLESALHDAGLSNQRERVALGPPRSIEQMLLIMELDAAEILVGELFRRRFRTTTFPERPRHFVGFYRCVDGSVLPVGYVHHDTWNSNSLCGGLVIDERMYRRIPPADREIIHAAGGVAEALLRRSFALLDDGLIAIWAHVGDKQSERVCLRVGYRHTESQYVMVIWLRDDLSDEEKAEWVRRVTEHGPF